MALITLSSVWRSRVGNVVRRCGAGGRLVVGTVVVNVTRVTVSSLLGGGLAAIGWMTSFVCDSPSMASAHFGSGHCPLQISTSHFKNTCWRSGNLKALNVLYTINVAPVFLVSDVFIHWRPRIFGFLEQPSSSDN